jgi:MYXO-CTERM domain-containing protein
MTYDGVNFGRGTNYQIYSSASLGAGAASVTQLVNTGAVSGVTLNLETVSNAGLGGWWIGIEFTGANAANTANGWRVVNGPTTGASINAFGIFNSAGSGVFQAFFAFGTPPGSTPSRMMVDVNGTLVPAPGAFALLGVAGLVGGRRRRS